MINTTEKFLGILAEASVEPVEQVVEQQVVGQQAVEISRSLLIGAGILFLVLIAVCICLAVICIRRGKTKEEKAVQKEAFPAVGTVLVGKLHEQGERSGQQDCFGVSDTSLMKSRGLLAVVADGMGGLSDGDKVSTAAVEAILDGFLFYQGKATPQQQLLMLAKQAVETVNELLGPAKLRKSGSTLVMGLVKDGMFSFLSIGDSRICLYRNGLLTQLNREHIFRNKLALDAVNGKISLQEVYTDQRGEGLTSFLGMGMLEHMDMPAAPLRLIPGDKLLLMSDGVYNALSEKELTAALGEDPGQAVEKIHQAIQEKGYTNQDNYTAVILECCAGEADETEGSAVEKAGPAPEALPHTEDPEH